MPSVARTRTRLARDASLLALSGGIAQAAGLVATIVLARLLSPGELGTYQQLLLVFGIASPLLFGGVPAGLTYFIARTNDPAVRRRLAMSGVLLLTALGAVFALGLVAAAPALADAFDNPSLTEALRLYAPYVFGAFVAAVLANVLIPAGLARVSAIASGIAAFAFLAAVITGALLGGAATIAAAASIFSVLYAVVCVAIVRRRVGLTLDRQRLGDDARAILVYGVPLALTGIAGILGYQFDRLVVSARFSPSDYAIYALGATELPVMLVIQQSINAVLLPELAARYGRGDLEGMGSLWRNAIDRTSLLLLPLFVLCMVLADDIVAVLFGPKYHESAHIFRIYLLMLPLRVATYGLLPMAIGRTKINLSASVVVLVSNAVLAIALVGPLGLSGPALAGVLSVLVTIAFYFVRLRAILGMGLHTLFPFVVVARNFLLCAAAGVVLVPVVLLDLPAVVALALGGLLYVPAVVAALRVGGAIAEEDWESLRGLVRRLRPGRAAERDAQA